MGARNVSAAFAMYADLPHGAMRLLLYMAHATRDDDRPDKPARVSWLGREALAEGLGYDLPPEPDPWDETDEAARARAARHSAFTVLKRQVKVLTDRGAITRLREGRRNLTAEYRLNLESLPQGQQIVAPAGQQIVAPQGQRIVASRGNGSLPPKRTEDLQKRTQEDNHQSSAPPRLAQSKPVDNDEDSSIRRALERLGPERQQRYLDAAHREGMSPTTSALIRRAAQLARVVP